MADDMKPEEAPQETEGEPEETNWKAKYDGLLAESRKWERRAKDNKAATVEAKKTADEQIAELQSQIDAMKKAEKLEKLRAKISEEKGIPASVIGGDTEEEMEAWADTILSVFKKPAAVSVPNPGRFERGAEQSTMQGYLRQLLPRN